jgi:hypothetical protein
LSLRLTPAVVLAMLLARPALALDLEVDVGLHAHALREYGANGDTLVRERGTSPRLAATALQPLGETWSARAMIAGWAGRAAYDGRTQGGLPVASRTDTQSTTVEGALHWRPPAVARLGVEAGLQVERFRRRLNGVDGFGGLDERLTQPRWLLGVDWRTKAWSVRACALWGDRAPLEVRFDDGLYDPVRLRSGRARGWMLQATRSIGRGWRVAASLESLAVARSGEASLTRGGSVVGVVAQPRWRRDRIGIAIERAFDD